MKKILAIVMALAMVFALCGCRSFGSSGDAEEIRASVPSMAAGKSYDYMADSVAAGDYGGFASNGTAVMFAAEQAEMPSPAAGGSSGAANTGEDRTQELDPEKIIYSANATMETTEFEKTIAGIEDLIEKLGGWVESGSVSGSNYSSISRGTKSSRSADYTIRVPNDRFQELMDELPNLGNVPYSHIYTENVTAEYYDTQARLTTYEAQEQRLLELLEMAETVSDVIEIENELTEVRYRIESLKTSLRGWDRRVSWSTLYLSVKEVFEYTPQEPVSYGGRLLEALKNGIENLGEFFLELLEALPELLLVLVLLIAVILILKKVIVSGKEKRAGRKAKKTAMKGEKTSADPEKQNP